jgi:hypothetical protein
MTLLLNGTTGVADVDGSASTPAIRGTDTNTGIFFPAADTIAFAEGGAEVARFDSSGNLGIGTSSPTSVARASFGNSSAGGSLIWASYFGTNSSGASAAPNFGLTLGWNYSGGGGESNIVYGTGLGSSAGLAFSSSDGTTVTERMRIDSSGNLLVGTTSRIGFCKVGIASDMASNNNLVIQNTNSANAGNFAFFINSAGNSAGLISQTGATTVAYATTSDYRLKENIAPMTGALDVVSALKPVTYTWKADGSDGQGFIAHELQEVVPECVAGEKDAVNEDGSIKPQGIDTSFLVATLTAAIQEQQAIITDLKSRIEALEQA